MKKTILFSLIITAAFASNVFVIGKNISSNSHNLTFFFDKNNKIITYMEKIKNMNINKSQQVFQFLQNKICSNPATKAYVEKGYSYEFIYFDDNKSVIIRINKCGKN
jgi:hypothetical protein